MSDSANWPLHPTAAIERGQWVIREIGSWATLAGVLPPRFESFVRIFHPASGQDLRWHGEEVHGENEHVVRWVEAAEREGAVMHPLAQWGALIDGYRQPKFGEDGWQYGEPGWGQMDLRELAAVAGVLARHTTTPGDCLATLWEGHGEINGSAVILTITDGDRFAEPLESHPAAHPAMAQALANPRLQIPQRDSLLFQLDIRVLTDPGWAQSAGWADRIGNGSLTPQMLWPERREWFLASEIDFNSTVIGGSPTLIAELLELGTTGAIEIMELPDEADLTSGGDIVNQRANGSLR